MSSRLLRIILITGGILAGAVLLLWGSLSWYIGSHKKELLERITTTLGDQIHGELLIRDIKPALWKDFPGISVSLSGVSLRDSLWQQHRRSLFEAENLYVRLNPLQLIRNRIDIRKITAANGYIFLFTDSSGYSNKYLLTPQDGRKDRGTSFSCRKFELEHMQLIMQDKIKQKLFQVIFRNADGLAEQKGGIWHTRLKLSAEVRHFAFNTGKGSFLKNTVLRSVLHLQFDPSAKHLSFREQEFRIDGLPVIISGTFFFDRQPAAFRLSIRSREVPFATAASWLSQSIHSKLDSIGSSRPIELDADIRGMMKYRDTPTVLLKWNTSKNDLQTPFADFTGCSFSGYFLNELVPGKGHNDANSVIVMHGVKAEWGGIPFRADSIRLENLSYPLLQFSFRSGFPLDMLNNIPSPLPFHFRGGKADVAISYRGGVRTNDTLPPSVRGHIRVSDGAFTYLPRTLSIRETQAELLLEEDNLVFNRIAFSTAGSKISMQGKALHFFRFYFSDPGKVRIDWQASSPGIDIADFMGLIGRRKYKPATGGKSTGRNKTAGRIIEQLDQVLDASDISLTLDIRKVSYHNFTAANVHARASLSQETIRLQNIRLQHAGGSVSLSGSINQLSPGNPFLVNTKISNVAVDKLFRAFDNFGQQTLLAKNLKGNFSAQAQIGGKMSDEGKLIGNSLEGTVDFRLEDGALVNFPPLEKISKFAFRKRDLSHIMFKNIRNTLSIRGNKIIIPPMTIASSALYIHLQGIYATTAGTDIFMEIPLRNPRRDGFDPSEAIVPEKGRKRRGITLYLRAQDDDKGNMKLSWDPRKKGEKNTDPAEEPD